MTDEPTCRDCSGPMRTVEVRHRTGMVTRTPICPTCLTSHQRREETTDQMPYLHLVRTSA